MISTTTNSLYFLLFDCLYKLKLCSSRFSVSRLSHERLDAHILISNCSLIMSKRYKKISAVSLFSLFCVRIIAVKRRKLFAFCTFKRKWSEEGEEYKWTRHRPPTFLWRKRRIGRSRASVAYGRHQPLSNSSPVRLWIRNESTWEISTGHNLLETSLFYSSVGLTALTIVLFGLQLIFVYLSSTRFRTKVRVAFLIALLPVHVHVCVRKRRVLHRFADYSTMCACGANCTPRRANVNCHN